MFTLLKLELEKSFRAKSFYLSFLVLIAFVALMLWGFYTYAARKTGGEAVEQFRYTYESRQYFNGLTFALYSLLFSFTLLLPIFVSLSAGSQVAGEARAGTLRMICTRPISRASLILSKFLVTAPQAALLLTFFIGLSLIVGLIFVGWGNLELYPVHSTSSMRRGKSCATMRLCGLVMPCFRAPGRCSSSLPSRFFVPSSSTLRHKQSS